MYIDRSLVLADAQAITTSGASTNYIDTLAAGNAYKAPWFIVLIKTAVTASGSATVTFDLRHDTDPAFGTETVLISSGAVAKATLVAGYFALKVQVPLGAKRYLRGYATIASGPLLTGAWDMKIVEDVDVLQP